MRWNHHYSMHRNHHHSPLHWNTRGTVAACAHVGRVGSLAVAFGIGTATVAGACAACAYADTGDGASAGSGGTSNSQSVNTRGPSRADRGSGPSTQARAHAGDSDIAPRAAAADRDVPPAVVDDEIHISLPEAAMAPSAPVETPDQTSAVSPALGRQVAPAAAEVHSTAVAAPAFVRPLQPVPQLQPVAVISSPPIASAHLATKLSTVFASLSEVISVNAPTTPVDSSVAVLVGAARRERDATLRGFGMPSPQTVAPAATTTSTTTVSVEAERMAVSPAGAGTVITDRTASGGSALAMVTNGTATTTVTVPGSTGLVVRAKASLNAGPPNMTLSIDGTPVTTIIVKSTSWADYTFAGAIPAGTHEVSISYSNNYDTATGQRNLFLDKVTTTTGPLGDEFTGKANAAPNGSIWTAKTGTGWDPGIENYVTGNAVLDGKGNLVIKAVKTASGGYTSGWVESRNKMSFGYGTTTARIKVPKGQGLWPAFWLKGADEDTIAWPQSGEIDVMELPSTTTTMYSTLHGPIEGSTKTQQAQIISNLPDLSNDYHNYWVRHLPDEITFGVDGMTLGTLTPDSLPAGATWVYNRPTQVILNLAVGGPWAGAPDATTPSTASMLVDWVRWEPA